MRSEQGQAITEYLLLLLILAISGAAVMRGIRGFGIGDRLTNWLTGSYRSSYTYGHPKAKGPNEGGPRFLPLATGGRGEGNGRLFISPEAR